MTNNIIEIYKAFINSILAEDEDWKMLVAEDVYLKNPLAEVQGKDDFIILNTPLFEAIKDMKTHQLVVEGNFLITQVTATIKKPNEEIIFLDISEWYEIKEGKVVALRTYFDSKHFI